MRTKGTVKWFNDSKGFGFSRARRARLPRTSS